MTSRTVSQNVFDDVCHRMKWLETHIKRLQNKRTRTIPIWDKAQLPSEIPDGTIFFAQDASQFGFKIDGNIYYADTTATAYSGS